MPVPVSLVWGAYTEVGEIRAQNEDSHAASPPVFAVADGMGGCAGGAVASRLAIEALETLGGPDAPVTAAMVLEAVDRANRSIIETGTGELAGMGTTLVGLALVSDGAQPYWLSVNIGDSRLYRYAGDRCEQITVDHVEPGNGLTRALGIDLVADVDCLLLLPVPGERFLLCSDGLHGELTDAAIAGLLATEADPVQASRALVRAAVEAGGHDNVTAVVVDVLGARVRADVDTVTAGRAST